MKNWEPRTNLAGQTFGLLTVLPECKPKRYRDTRGAVISTHTYWLCQCVCGRKKMVGAVTLKGKPYSTKSCGCMKRGPKKGTTYGRRAV